MENIANIVFFTLLVAEYAYTLKVIEKSDVYSFGVGDWKTTEWSFLWGEQRYSEVDDEDDARHMDLEWANWIIDSRMNASTCNYKEIRKTIDVVILCTSSFPITRPSMRRVVELLRDKTMTAPNVKWVKWPSWLIFLCNMYRIACLF